MSIYGYLTLKDGKPIQILKGTQPRRDLDKLRSRGIIVRKLKKPDFLFSYKVAK